jgi:hypothetical protein
MENLSLQLPQLKEKLTRKTTSPAKHTSRKGVRLDAAAEASVVVETDVAVASVVVETDVAVAADLETAVFNFPHLIHFLFF